MLVSSPASVSSNLTLTSYFTSPSKDCSEGWQINDIFLKDRRHLGKNLNKSNRIITLFEKGNDAIMTVGIKDYLII